MAKTVDYILKISSKAAQDALKKTAKEAVSVNSNLMQTVTAAGATVTAMGTLANGVLSVANAFIDAAKAIVQFSQESADLINDINDLSTRSAIATDTIKGLQFALRASGQDAGSATALLSKFPMVLSQAEEESSRTAEAFNDLGIKINDASGNLRSADSIFNETIIALQGIEDQTLRAKTASEIFGRSAGQLLQALGQNQSLSDFVKLTEKFGVRTGPKASAAAADFQITIAALETVTDGLKSSFIEAFGGGITNLLIDFATQIAFLQRVVVSFTDEATKGFEIVIKVLKGLFEFGLKLAKGAGITLASQIPIIGGFAQAALEVADSLDIFDSALSAIADRTVPNFTDKLNQAKKDAKEFRVTLEGLASGGAGAGAATGAGAGSGAGAAAEPPAITKSIKLISFEISDGFRAGSLVLFETLSPLEQALQNVKNAIFASSKAIQDIGKAISSPQSFISAIGAAAGPIGEAIGGALGALASLGERSPEEIQAQFQGFAEAVGKGLETLPRVLIQVLPKFVISLIKGFGLALLKLPAIIADSFLEAFKSLWESIKDFFRSIFTKEGRQEKRRERRARRKRGEGFFQNLFETDSGFLSGGRMQAAQSGMRFTGSKRGLAMLHEGETVIPASGRTGQADQRSMRNASGSPINIVINSAVVEGRAIDELVRKLESRFSTFGAGKTSLFGR